MKYPPLPDAVVAEAFWDRLGWALEPHDLTPKLAADIAQELRDAKWYSDRLTNAPPERHAELANDVAEAAIQLQDALRRYDAFAVPILGPPNENRAQLEELLDELVLAAGELPSILVEDGWIVPRVRRSGRPLDLPLFFVASGTIEVLDRHRIPRERSNEGLTARVLRVTLGAFDQIRGEIVKPREDLKKILGVWFSAIDDNRPRIENPET